jgi:hypothetical protein
MKANRKKVVVLLLKWVEDENPNLNLSRPTPSLPPLLQEMLNLVMRHFPERLLRKLHKQKIL